MADLESAIIVLVVILGLGMIYLATRRPRRLNSTVVVIQEGRWTGLTSQQFSCPKCGRRFKHMVFFKEEIVKCPYCGTELS